MREYEFTFVIQPEISEEGVASICERFEGMLERDGSSKLFYEDMGRRRLAYEIQKFQKGRYLVMHFLSDGKIVRELERTARLEDSVLRFLTVLADPEVQDIEARRAEAEELEKDRLRRAVEKAEREAEEAAARAAQQAAGEEAEAEGDAEQEARAASESEESAEPVADDEGEDDDSRRDAAAEASEDAASEEAASDDAASDDAASDDAASEEAEEART